MEVIFLIIHLKKKWREISEGLHMVSTGLQKTYDG